MRTSVTTIVVAATLSAAVALPTGAWAAQQFDDVPADSIYAESVERLTAAGVIEGCDADSYCPTDFMSRGQMALLLDRLSGTGDVAPTVDAATVMGMTPAQLRGQTGPAGPQGPAGPRGDTGPAGPQGDAGPDLFSFAGALGAGTGGASGYAGNPSGLTSVPAPLLGGSGSDPRSIAAVTTRDLTLSNLTALIVEPVASNLIVQVIEPLGAGSQRPLLQCTIPAGSTSCSVEAGSTVLAAGSRFLVLVFVPLTAGDTPPVSFGFDAEPSA